MPILPHELDQMLYVLSVIPRKSLTKSEVEEMIRHWHYDPIIWEVGSDGPNEPEEGPEED